MGEWLKQGLRLRPLKLPFSVVLLDPPMGLEARRADEGGHVVLRWLPPPGAPMASLIRYEVNISAGSVAGSAQRVRLAPTAQPQGYPKGPAPESRQEGHHGPTPPSPAPKARQPIALALKPASRPPTRPLSHCLPNPPESLDRFQGLGPSVLRPCGLAGARP